MLRAYGRCSSDTQELVSQEYAVGKWVDGYGDGQPVEWYRDAAVMGDEERPELDRLLADIQPGDTLVCYALDRISREGALPVLLMLDKLAKQRVRLVSISEPWLASRNPLNEALVALVATLAKMEKQ